MQAGGRFVKHEKHAFFGERLFAGRFGFGSFGQETRQLQALGFATTECGHGLAKLDVVQAHIDDGLQCADNLTIVGENF